MRSDSPIIKRMKDNFDVEKVNGLNTEQVKRLLTKEIPGIDWTSNKITRFLTSKGSVFTDVYDITRIWKVPGLFDKKLAEQDSKLIKSQNIN